MRPRKRVPNELQEEVVVEIQRMLADHWPKVQIARALGISTKTVKLVDDGLHVTLRRGSLYRRCSGGHLVKDPNNCLICRDREAIEAARRRAREIASLQSSQ